MKRWLPTAEAQVKSWTPLLHAIAVPDADRSRLKRPEIAASGLVTAIGTLLASMRCERMAQEAVQ